MASKKVTLRERAIATARREFPPANGFPRTRSNKEFCAAFANGFLAGYRRAQRDQRAAKKGKGGEVWEPWKNK